MSEHELAVSREYVDFYSPGTFVAETRRMDIAAWDVEEAQRMAAEITERYNARPYGFRFVTMGRTADEMDSRQIKKSPMYYLGGTVRTLAEVEADAKPDERILRENMRCNGYARVIENRNSWRWTQPLGDDDVVLPTPEWAAVAEPSR